MVGTICVSFPCAVWTDDRTLRVLFETGYSVSYDT